MPFPAGIQTVTVTMGPYLDASGRVTGGSVTFTPEWRLVHEPTGSAILARPVTAVIDPTTGVGTVQLVASNSTGLTRTNFRYLVSYAIAGDGQRQADYIVLPAATPNVDLEAVVPVEGPDGSVVAVPQVTSVAGRSGAVTAQQVATDVSPLIAYPVTQVAGQTGDVTSVEIATALDLSANYAPTAAPSAGVAVRGDQGLLDFRFRGFRDAIGWPTSGTYSARDVVIDQTGHAWRCVTGGTPGVWRALSTGYLDQQATDQYSTRVSNGGTAVSLSATPTTIPCVDTGRFPTDGTLLLGTPQPESVVPVRVLVNYTGKTPTSFTGCTTVDGAAASVPDGTGIFYAKSGLARSALNIANQIVAKSGIDSRPHDLVLVAAFDDSVGHTRGDYDIILTREAGSYGVLSINLPVHFEQDTPFKDGLGNTLLTLAAGQADGANGANPNPLPQGHILVSGTLVGQRGTDKSLRMQLGSATASMLLRNAADTTTIFSVTDGKLFILDNTTKLQWTVPSGQPVEIQSDSSSRLNFKGGSGGTRFLNNAFSATNLVIADSGTMTLRNGVQIITGTGSPEGVVAAPVSSHYHRTDGGAGTSFYVKESGTGNTGWVAK